MATIQQHEAVQAIAKQVLAALGPTLLPTDTERTIAERCRQLLDAYGIHETWYYDCPAYVLAASRTCISISGRDYVPADQPIGHTGLVTVDLSPSRDGVWGDCARSFFLEEGIATSDPQLPEFARGQAALYKLHASLFTFVTPETTFHQLWQFAADEVQAMEFMTLDFLGNFGHTIETNLDDRSYIEAGNQQRLGDTQLFTFEPHIKSQTGTWGFKHEEIYYFDGNGRLRML